MQILKLLFYSLLILLIACSCTRQTTRHEQLKKEAAQKVADGNIVAAIEIYHQILSENPEDIKSMNNLGQLYAFATLYDKAEDILLKALDKDPTNSSILNNLGSLYLNAGKIKKAQEMLEKALKEKPDNVQSITMLASIYQQQKKLEKAHVLLDRVLSIDPDYKESLLIKGFLYLDQHDLDNAEKTWHRLYLKDPLFAPVIMQLAKLFHVKKEYDKEIEILNKSIALDIQHPSIYTRYSNILEMKGNYDEAISTIEKATHLKEQDPLVYYSLGFLLLDAKNDVRGANQHFQTAYRLNPRLISVYNLGLACIAKFSNKDETAQNYIRQARSYKSQLPVDMKHIFSYYYEKYFVDQKEVKHSSNSEISDDKNYHRGGEYTTNE